MRWDYRRGQNSRPGDMVIDAFVRARLLGLRLLTLEARVVVGKEDGSGRLASARGLYPAAGHPSGPRAPELAPASGYAVPAAVTGPELERARELLAEGEHTLALSRRRLR